MALLQHPHHTLSCVLFFLMCEPSTWPHLPPLSPAAHDAELTRSVKILRQRQVQANDNGLRRVNPPGCGHFILLMPNSVIVLNTGTTTEVNVDAAYISVDRELYSHPKSVCSCAGQYPRCQWTHTPCGARRGREESEPVQMYVRFNFEGRVRTEKAVLT